MSHNILNMENLAKLKNKIICIALGHDIDWHEYKNRCDKMKEVNYNPSSLDSGLCKRCKTFRRI